MFRGTGLLDEKGGGRRIEREMGRVGGRGEIEREARVRERDR